MGLTLDLAELSPVCGVIIYYTYLGFRDRAWCLLGLLGLLVEASCARRDLRSLRYQVIAFHLNFTDRFSLFSAIPPFDGRGVAAW